MDDYASNILNDSKNEWSILLINNISCHIIDGFRSIFNESLELCQTNDEPDKYLMTFQNLLSRIPNWNQIIISNERERIVTKSKCSYLEDLVTCVHIIQLKLLSCVRVGQENKCINIDIPEFNIFLHKIYIHIARKLYSNIYLFELDIAPLEQQRRNREFELLVQVSIMNTIRDNLPVEQILRQYIDETQEIDTTKVESIIQNKPIPEEVAADKPNIEEVIVDKPTIPDVIKSDVINYDVINTDIPTNISTDIPTNNTVNTDPINTSEPDTTDLTERKPPVLTFHPDVKDNEPYSDSLTIGDEITLNLDIEQLDEPNNSLDLEFEEIL